MSGNGTYTNTIKAKKTNEPFHFIDANVWKYSGQFLNGKFHGKGHVWYHTDVWFRNEEEYEGEFQNGLREGKGTWYYSNKRQKLEIYWKKNEPFGLGNLSAKSSPDSRSYGPAILCCFKGCKKIKIKIKYEKCPNYKLI